jgi:hypothetical protein
MRPINIKTGKLFVFIRRKRDYHAPDWVKDSIICMAIGDNRYVVAATIGPKYKFHEDDRVKRLL